MNMLFFTDCQDIVKNFAGMVTRKILGLIPNPHQYQHKWALDEIYELAAKLEASGVKIVLAWVKAHRSGAGRQGNYVVDAACNSALREGIVAAKVQEKMCEALKPSLPK